MFHRVEYSSFVVVVVPPLFFFRRISHASQQPGLLERPPLGQRGPRAPVALGPVERALDEPPVDPPLGPPRDLGPRARRPARQPVGRRDQPVGHRRRDRLGQDRARAARVAVEGAREAHRPFGGRRLMRFAVTLGPQNRGAGGAACAFKARLHQNQESSNLPFLFSFSSFLFLFCSFVIL